MQNLTDISTIRHLCEKHGFAFSKSFGQNFIINPGVCPKICEVAHIDETSNVLEIGPGFGTLTQQLAMRAKKVVALEVDARLLPVLNETLADYPCAKIIHQDALKCDIALLLAEEFDAPASVCANLPYYITSPLIMKLLESRLPLTQITVMVQKEAGERIVATPGTRATGAISYAVHYYSTPALEFTVKPGSFYPPPKVTSAVITLVPRKILPLQAFPVREKRLFSLIRAAFGQRRKTFVNSAAAGLSLPKPALNSALLSCGLNPLSRPEQLTLEEFILLEKKLWENDD